MALFCFDVTASIRVSLPGNAPYVSQMKIYEYFLNNLDIDDNILQRASLQEFDGNHMRIHQY